MKQIVVRENRIPLVIGIIDTVVFLIFLFFSIRDGILNHDNIQIIFCGVVFGGFAVLGIALIMEGCLRKVVIGLDECYYRCFYGRKIFFHKDDIAYCESFIKNMETQYCLYNNYHKKIASFEDNMLNSQSLITYLYRNNIPIKTMNSHTKKKEF